MFGFQPLQSSASAHTRTVPSRSKEPFSRVLFATTNQLRLYCPVQRPRCSLHTPPSGSGPDTDPGVLEAAYTVNWPVADLLIDDTCEQPNAGDPPLQRPALHLSTTASEEWPQPALRLAFLALAYTIPRPPQPSSTRRIMCPHTPDLPPSALPNNRQAQSHYSVPLQSVVSQPTKSWTSTRYSPFSALYSVPLSPHVSFPSRISLLMILHNRPRTSAFLRHARSQSPQHTQPQGPPWTPCPTPRTTLWHSLHPHALAEYVIPPR